ncbi:hypothetical protein Poly51_25180 [Rubripirellula tenax]|uniref:Uncharacterized protein n=1 Tax=Rubripirellula tenax TaxID=2528015 RepID=A0A5C6F6J2_9BACT|nr:hypothetical protein [Rubripirellula tenax]TWU56602.1 hypothetical protein Poly51_25180 [Rubripirellula tenax]
MPVFDECCVLIPASTLEDFPTKLSDDDARSLLAGWTVLWHPRLLAQTEQTPAWYRADAPPEPPAKRMIVAPAPSLAKLPQAYAQRAIADADCRWITGANRAEMEAALGLDPCDPCDADPSVVDGSGRKIGVEDFYAAGFVALQIQIMTRRLRYTSNLDEIFLQTRLVTAAKAFLQGDGPAATAALHEVFDALAEERDHYFTSDPHLIDLTLVTDSTVDALIDAWAARPMSLQSVPNSDSPQLATPGNLLFDGRAAIALSTRTDAPSVDLLGRLRGGEIGWAGGGPDSDRHLDAMTLVQSQDAFVAAHQQATEAIGIAPLVYGRLTGATPSDMTATITKLGYQGMIPIDFAGGSGFGDEAKVILQAGGAEIEALTAKPIDAASDASFLAIGAKLGEAIDSGEIATALLVHWPGQGCESFHDLRRSASWGVSLGRFWRIDRYFTEGEHPYHHANTSATTNDSAVLLNDLVEAETADPVSSIAAHYRAGIVAERDAMIRGMAALVRGTASDDNAIDAAESFATAVGAKPSDATGQSKLIINPYSNGVRHQTLMQKDVGAADHVFAASSVSGGVAATADVPACGFVSLKPGKSNKQSSMKGWLRNKWLGNPTSIAEGGRLQNEFLEASIHPESGGISGVYSGTSRGNRFSMRLVAVGLNGHSEKAETTMKCDKIRVVESTTAKGVIEVTGKIIDDQNVSLAMFKVQYTLARGSRVIDVDGEVSPATTTTSATATAWGDDPWRSYIAARVAVASDASICRVLLRDKVHRGGARRLVSPLGLLIDEADRQTMVGTSGLAFHRRVDQRFFDTILSVRGEAQAKFSLHYGFDVSNPITSAKSAIAPPIEVDIAADGRASDIGWIVHSSPKDLVVSAMEVFRRDDGALAATVRIIQTRPKSCNATLRFFRDVEFACLAGDDESERLAARDDQVSVAMAAHAVTDLLVVFKPSGDST